MVAQYDTAVHYMDETGMWKDIDNTLSISGSEISTANAKIKFAKKTNGSNEIFTLHNGNQKLSLSLNGANKKVKGKITNIHGTVLLHLKFVSISIMDNNTVTDKHSG